ncbi:MAG TPA: hypothetical protein VOA87_13740 [Thermoanaerobaculia bacterium]|nr:hypothetical protein [Thermoanaerobaculia bacterium]
MRSRAFLSAFAFGLLLAGSALAFDRQSALGSQGEIYFAQVGTYSTLFPGGKAYPGQNVVLALDVTFPGQDPQRLLVPGTSGPEVEGTPFLLYEQASGALFMVWQGEIALHPILNLVSFKDGQWGQVAEVSGNFAAKLAPQLAVTRDSYQVPSTDGATSSTVQRTVLHLVWAEENAAGSQDTFYTPIILDDGQFQGNNNVYRLNDFDTSAPATLPYDVGTGMQVAPRLEPGRDGQTVVVTFADAPSKRIVAVEVAVLPQDLSRLADRARAQIIEVGVKLYPAQMKALADSASGSILANGGAFYPDLVQSMADKVHAYILATPPSGTPGGLVNLSAGARAQIIEVGVQLSHRGLKSLAAASSAQAPVVEESTAGTDASGTQTCLLQFQIASSRPVPVVGSGKVTYYSSEGGDAVLISWQLGNNIDYRDSNGAGWNDIHEIKLTNILNLDLAQRMLDQRVRQ